MTLNIIQRLTLLSSFLSALVIAAATVALGFMMWDGYKSDAAHRSDARAQQVVDDIIARLDDDILVDFHGADISLGDIDIGASDWAAIRQDGSVKYATGIFSSADIANAAFMLDSMTRDESRYRLGRRLLMPGSQMTFADLPDPVRSTVHATAPDRLFLSVKRGIEEDEGDVLEVKLLGDDILELEITPDGRLVEQEPEELPESLPDGLLASVPVSRRPATITSISWTAFKGQLIAIVDGLNANHESLRVAVNRFGERVVLDESGHVTSVIEDSRLWVVVATNVSDEMAALQSRMLMVGLGGIGIWTGLTAIGWCVARRAMLPIRGMIKTAKHIETTNLEERIPVGRPRDELHELANTLNDMLDRIKAGYERVQQFSDDVSHELRGPLTKLIAEVDVTLTRERDVPEYQGTLVRLKRHASQLNQLVESLLLLSRLERGRQAIAKEPIDLMEVAFEVVNTFGDLRERINIQIPQTERSFMVVGDRNLISVMIRNLVDNALRYSPADAPVTLRISGELQNIKMEIEDAGPGIPTADAEKVFDRFYRLEKSRSKETGGLGLGLAIVKVIAAVHQVTVDLRRAPQGGTVVAFSLPLATGS